MANIGFMLSDNSRLLRRVFDERVREIGVTGPQARLLLTLAREGSRNQGFYAEELEVEPITLCRMVDRLEESGMVERQRDPNDRRAWQIRLTAKAEDRVAELRKCVEGMMEDTLTGLTIADRDQLVHCLDVMGRNLGARRALSETVDG